MTNCDTASRGERGEGKINLLLKIFREELSENRLAILMNVPAILMITGIIAYPLAYALFLSFHKVGIGELRTGVMPFYGWNNFIHLLQDGLFWHSVKNTLHFSAVVVVGEVLLGVGIAFIIEKSKGALSTFTRVIMLLPWAVPPIVNALLWSFIFSAEYGYLNAILMGLGFIDTFVMWLGNPQSAIYAVAFAYIWRTTPFSILLIHAAMQGIPRELYEAGNVDGTSAWQSFRYIMLPLITPTILIVMILRTTWAFQVFDEIFGMTGGGPGNSTWVASYYSYRYAFRPPLDIGLGAASAFVLALMIGILAFLYIKFLRRAEVEWA